MIPPMAGSPADSPNNPVQTQQAAPLSSVTASEVADGAASAAPDAQHSDPLRLTTKAQWEALTSPIRFDIVGLLSSCGPSSVNDLAWQMGRNSDSLYYHVRKLVAVEMVIPAGERSLPGQNSETLYRINGSHVVVDDLEVPEARPYLTRLLAATLRMTDREVRQALESEEGALTHSGPERTFDARRDLVWLGAEDLEQVNEHLAAVRDIIESRRHNRRGRLFSITTFLAPLVRATDPQGRPVPRD